MGLASGVRRLPVMGVDLPSSHQMWRRLQTRWGRTALRREPPAERTRQGRRLDDSTSVVFLAPGHSPGLRAQLFDLVDGVDGHPDIGSWSIVVDTGMTRKAHAKARAQRIKRLEESQVLPPEFPQNPSVHLCWRDDLDSRGLPTETPDILASADVLIHLDGHRDNLVLHALLKRSKVGFKVGPSGSGLDALDFMLTWPEGGDMSSFVQLAFHYLKTLDLK